MKSWMESSIVQQTQPCCVHAHTLPRTLHRGAMTEACPSYLGGGDQEDRSSRTALAKSSQDPHLNQWLVATCAS
jgi:hypothetical protein